MDAIWADLLAPCALTKREESSCSHEEKSSSLALVSTPRFQGRQQRPPTKAPDRGPLKMGGFGGTSMPPPISIALGLFPLHLGRSRIRPPSGIEQFVTSCVRGGRFVCARRTVCLRTQNGSAAATRKSRAAPDPAPSFWPWMVAQINADFL
jgi:hypothetical protein